MNHLNFSLAIWLLEELLEPVHYSLYIPWTLPEPVLLLILVGEPVENFKA